MQTIELEKPRGPVGESVPRNDIDEKITGAAIYADDIRFGNDLLFARIKRSPHPHALVKSIDTSKAKALPGVKVVVTGDDFPGHIGLYLKDRHIFARDRVRFVGEAVAGVAAVSEELAEKAVTSCEKIIKELEERRIDHFGDDDQLLGPVDGFLDAVQVVPDRGIRRNFKLGGLGEDQDRLQEIRKVVRNRTGQPAHGLQSLGMDELLFQIFAIGQILPGLDNADRMALLITKSNDRAVQPASGITQLRDAHLEFGCVRGRFQELRPGGLPLAL